MSAKTPLNYYGGKQRIAKWIISHFPPHECYVEPFGGGAAVLFAKPPSPVEVYNDIDGALVEFFRVLQDERLAAELIRRVVLTPYSRSEFERAKAVYREYQKVPEKWRDDDKRVEVAWAIAVRIVQSIGGRGESWSYGRTDKKSALNLRKWVRLPALLEAAVGRLKCVQIEHDDALKVIERYDSPETLFYLDPPYYPESRASVKDYAYEMTPEQHYQLLECVLRAKGYVVLSGYDNSLYASTLSDWARVERKTRTFAFNSVRSPRREVLWLSPRTWKALRTLKFQEVINEGV